MDDEPPGGEPWSPPRGCCAGLGAACLLILVGGPILLLDSFISRVEVARAASPDGAIDAVITEINGGATTDFAYAVSVETRGWFGASTPVAYFYAAHRSDCANGVNLRWIGPDRLAIEYQDAERAEARPAAIAGRSIEVALRPRTTDPNAPCGGMEYNLHGRRHR